MTVAGGASLENFWSLGVDELFHRLGSGPDGLTTAQANERQADVQPLGRRVNSDLNLFARQFKSPIIVLLLAAAAVSAALEEVVQSLVVVCVVVTSALLGWWQERGAVRAIESLLRSVQVHADVLRDGREVELFETDVVPGDVVVFAAGDVVPGDCRILSATRLVVDEAVLTGESHPRDKLPGVVPVEATVPERSNVLFHGSHVASGECRAMVVRCGVDTEFGHLASSVARTHVPTSFERGVARYGMMLAEATAMLVVVVFSVNIVRGQPFLGSVLFALALAVGITPQMLPVIVTVSLASGARLLARHHVVVKRLDAIEDIGSIDTLCVDKTGTLTEGVVSLATACDPSGTESTTVLELASWNARLQRGFDNPIDRAVVDRRGPERDYPMFVAEVPFDFARRMMSVVVESRGPDRSRVLVTKGDVLAVMERCRFTDVAERDLAGRTFEALSNRGLRVLAVATRVVGLDECVDQRIERGLHLSGFLAFEDPVKHDAADAVTRLAGLGITVKVITGDNRLAARHAADVSGIRALRVTTGREIETLSDTDLAVVAAETDVFAEIGPLAKQRIVRVLSESGRSVAFMGDGVNDAAALHAADVGISVDRGVDVAKQVSDVILLDKDLTVLSDAVRRGRRVFANTLTYVKVTTSANFGNMVSLVAASVFLPYLPLLPLQILLLNFLSDIPGVTVAADDVDPERVAEPGKWDVVAVRRFMVVFGLVSTVTDMATFAMLLWLWDADMSQVRTGWFTVSLLTEVFALLVLRTTRVSWRSRPAPALLGASLLVVIVALLVPSGIFPDVLGFVRLDAPVASSLVMVAVLYVITTEIVKKSVSVRTSGR